MTVRVPTRLFNCIEETATDVGAMLGSVAGEVRTCRGLRYVDIEDLFHCNEETTRLIKNLEKFQKWFKENQKELKALAEDF